VPATEQGEALRGGFAALSDLSGQLVQLGVDPALAGVELRRLLAGAALGLGKRALDLRPAGTLLAGTLAADFSLTLAALVGVGRDELLEALGAADQRLDRH